MKPYRPIFDLLLLRGTVPDATIATILAHVKAPTTHQKLTAVLKAAPLDEQLKHDLWKVAYGQLDTEPVSEVAAMEIFREVLREYQAFNELGPKERKGAIQEFILSVESQIRAAIVGDFEAFRAAVLNGDKVPAAWKRDALACGRYFAAAGTWPVKPETFKG